MRTIIEDMLKKVTSLPVEYRSRPQTPGISFHFFNKGGILYGDGKATEQGGMCQIDIWYKKDIGVENIAQKIRDRVNELFKTDVEEEEDFDATSLTYRTMIIFEYIR